MIQHLTIQNFILIQSIDVDLTPNFNVFTGETGSGKSMLVDAIIFGLGQRSSSNVIGKNGNSARVEIVLSLPNNVRINEKLNEIGIDPEEDGTVILSREIYQDGRNVSRINGRSVTLSSMKAFVEGTIDIHSQHETQDILEVKNHRSILDQYAGSLEILATYRTKYQAYRDAVKAYETFKLSDISPEEVSFAAKELEYLEMFEPSQEDYENLLASIESMSNYEKNQLNYDAIKETLRRDFDVLGKLYQLINNFESLGDDAMLEQYRDAYFNLEDVYETVVKKEAASSFDINEFERLQDRAYQYQKLIKKHGSVEGIQESIENYKATLLRSSNYDDLCVDYENSIESLKSEAMELADKLSEARKQAALELEPRIETQLKDLLLEHARFEVSFETKALSDTGIDDVKFLVSMNKGERLATLDKVVSGGEMSRLMLGIKVIFAKLLDTKTLIFDEIDTGVSGRAGFQIGAKMKALGKDAQVITISHLSSVAACGDAHFAITKSQDSSQTVTALQEVSGEARVEELALIMSGFINDSSLDAARNLLAQGQAI